MSDTRFTQDENTPDLVALDAALNEVKAHELARKEAAFLLPGNGLIDLSREWRQGSWREITIDAEVDYVVDAAGNPVEDSEHRCNTSMCLAGWVAELDPSVEWKVDPTDYYKANRAFRTLHSAVEMVRSLATRHTPEDSPFGSDIAVLRKELAQARDKAEELQRQFGIDMDKVIPVGATDIESQERQVEYWAQERLRLTADQTAALFHGDNDLELLDSMVDRLRIDPTDSLSDNYGDEEYDGDDEDDEEEYEEPTYPDDEHDFPVAQDDQERFTGQPNPATAPAPQPTTAPDAHLDDTDE